METIPTDLFVNEMERRWAYVLGNVSSPALRATWHQIGKAFNAHIADECPPWTVLQPATGTGKSQSAVVFASMLSMRPVDEHPGMLLVTRLITEADNLAAQINELSGRAVATAYHRDTKGTIARSDLCACPVLVITHNAFLRAMDPKAPSGNPWESLSRWRAGERRLIVIDEALDIVGEASVTLDGLRRTLAAVPEWARPACAGDVRILQAVISAMEGAASSAEGARDRVYTAADVLELIGAESPTAFEAMRAQLSAIRLEFEAFGREDLEERARLCRQHRSRLEALGAILSSWVYHARRKDKHALYTARQLVPSTGRGAVVFDATADCNLTYELFGVYPTPPPAGARTYDNVTVHVSYGHNVGRDHLKRNAATAVPDLYRALAAELSPTRNVFMVCHKDVEAQATGFDTPFSVSIGHYGAVDGSNEWQLCDVCVVFGVPYLPDSRPVNVFFALRGAQSTEWVQGKERPYGSHADICRALHESHIVVSIVQAINRTRCRRVTNERGDCEPVDIYLLLPPRETPLVGAILEGIRRSMPGVRLVDWKFDGAMRKATHQPKRSDHRARLLKRLENMGAGKVSLSRLGQELRIPTRTLTRIVAEAVDKTTAIAEGLACLGVTFEAHGAGPGSRRCFVKA